VITPEKDCGVGDVGRDPSHPSGAAQIAPRRIPPQDQMRPFEAVIARALYIGVPRTGPAGARALSRHAEASYQLRSLLEIGCGEALGEGVIDGAECAEA
jgi:hypothetical protein